MQPIYLSSYLLWCLLFKQKFKLIRMMLMSVKYIYCFWSLYSLREAKY